MKPQKEKCALFFGGPLQAKKKVFFRELVLFSFLHKMSDSSRIRHIECTKHI